MGKKTMSETVGSMFLNKTMAAHAVGIGGFTVVTAPQERFNDYLITHGWGLLSWAEWFKVVAAIYVTALLIKMTISAVVWVVKKVKKLTNREQPQNEEDR